MDIFDKLTPKPEFLRGSIPMNRWLTLALLAAVGGLANAQRPDLAKSAPPVPRVLETYSSFPAGSCQQRAEHDALLAKLGWPSFRAENTKIQEIVRDLQWADVFLPVSVYNYDHPQPFERYRDQWLSFLNRGGMVVASDANYGQQIGWVTQLGDELALQAGMCPVGMKEARQRKIKIETPDDPLAPLADVTVPWAHFASHGAGWKVLARCPEGHAVCLKKEIGKGVLVAATLYTECGYPTAEYLARVWEAQRRKLMDQSLSVELDRGQGAVGKNLMRIKACGSRVAADTVAVCEVRRYGERWQPVEPRLKLIGDGTAVADAVYGVTGGTTEVRVTVQIGGQARWWTSFALTHPDICGRSGRLQTRLTQSVAQLKSLPPGHTLQVRHGALANAVSEIRAKAETITAGEAHQKSQQEWQALDTRLGDAEEQIAILEGRLAVCVRMASEGGKPAELPFAVIRSHPLEKLHRDAAPAGPWRGPVRLEAARGEGESVQFGVVPLRGDLADVCVRLEPLQNASGRAIPADTAEIHRVCFVHVQGPSSGAPPEPHWWPDPLLPAGKPFAARRVCQPVWIDLTVPRDAKAGRYTGAVVIEAAGHTERVPLELDVFDFELPIVHSLREFFTFRAWLVGQKYFGGSGDDYLKKIPVEKILQMADVCLKRRIGVQVLGNEMATQPCSLMPYLREKRTPQGWEFDWTDTDRILAHLVNAGLRTLPAGNATTATGLANASRQDYFEFLQAYFANAQSHLAQKGWLDYAVFYMVDEPWQEEAVLGNVRVAGIADRVAPRLKRLMTAPRDPRLDGLAQIWVPGGMPDAHPDDKEQQERIKFWRGRGAEMWWYICCGPVHPYPNFFVDYPTIDSRMVFWLTWKYGKTGFLYWGVEYHGDPKEMTPDGPTERYSVGPPHMGNGDGTLCYWGPDMVLYPSVRLNAIRDGIEDYEYFALLKRRIEKAEAKGRFPERVAEARKLLAVDPTVVKLVSRSPNFEYTFDPGMLSAARRELAQMIMRLEP
jgi:hypothetical protein